MLGESIRAGESVKQCWSPYHFGPSSSLRLSILDVWACKGLTLVYSSWDLATITCPRTIIEKWNRDDGKSFPYKNKLIAPPPHTHTRLELVLRFRGSDENNLWLYRDGVLHTEASRNLSLEMNVMTAESLSRHRLLSWELESDSVHFVFTLPHNSTRSSTQSIYSKHLVDANNKRCQGQSAVPRSKRDYYRNWF